MKVVFSQTMDTGVAPSLVFNPDVAGGGSPTLVNGSGIWSTTTATNDTYTVIFDVADWNVELQDITVDVAAPRASRESARRTTRPRWSLASTR